MTKILSTLLVLAIAAVVGAAGFIWSGWYDISATAQHTQPVYSLLQKTMHRSVRLRSEKIDVPPLGGAEQVDRGALCFITKCAQCHGGPGYAQDEIGRSMQPLPGPLVDASKRWEPQQLYWITANGIKMSGMPAWRFRLPDSDLWALVAFMERLPGLSAEEFTALVNRHRDARCEAANADEEAEGAPSGASADPERGKLALTQFACNACHLIPGVTGSRVHVGPPLAGIANRKLIAGSVPNTPQQMVRWLRDPRSIDPFTAMPDMQVGERDARDIAAYLATLH